MSTTNKTTKKGTGKPELPQKVFIPDNEGGGTWEPWKDDRPTADQWKQHAMSYRAHADKLAEALRELLRVDTLPIQFATNSQRIRLKRRALEECRAALANWEAAQ